MTEEALQQKGVYATESEPEKKERLLTASFTGTGKEYFNIWIVNLIFSILTLGIYSAWATVRNRKYIYGHTWLDGHNFDFHGNPKSIVVGRMIAISLLALYLFGAYLNVWIPIIVLGLVLLILPFLIVRSLRFRLRNTSYRNLRFNFVGKIGWAFKAFSPAYILGVGYIFFYVFSLKFADPEQATTEIYNIKNSPILFVSIIFLLIGVAVYPVFVSWRSKFFYNNIYYGDHLLASEPKIGKIYKIYLATIAQAVGAFIIAMFGIFLFTVLAVTIGKGLGLFGHGYGGLVGSAIGYILSVPMLLFVYAFWKTRLVNHIFQTSTWGAYEFKVQWKANEYWNVVAGNFFLTIFTLGLGYPWATIRLARYKAENFAIRANDLDNLSGTPIGDSRAIGEEMTDAFDFEFGI